MGRTGPGRRRTGGHGKGSKEDEDKGENGGRNEEPKHPMRRGFGDFKSISDVCRESNY